MIKFRYGDVVYVNMGNHGRGDSLQSGTRPCVVVSNDKFNTSAGILNVLPLTSKIGKNHNPVHVLILPEDVNGCRIAPSLILTEQMLTVSDYKIIGKVGNVDKESGIMDMVKDALRVQLAL